MKTLVLPDALEDPVSLRVSADRLGDYCVLWLTVEEPGERHELLLDGIEAQRFAYAACRRLHWSHFSGHGVEWILSFRGAHPAFYRTTGRSYAAVILSSDNLEALHNLVLSVILKG